MTVKFGFEEGELEEVALQALEERHSEGVFATNFGYFYAAGVLDLGEIPPPVTPTTFGCSRVAGWSAYTVEQKRTGRLLWPSPRSAGPATRSLQPA
jgi:citrate synthase